MFKHFVVSPKLHWTVTHTAAVSFQQLGHHAGSRLEDFYMMWHILWQPCWRSSAFGNVGDKLHSDTRSVLSSVTERPPECQFGVAADVSLHIIFFYTGLCFCVFIFFIKDPDIF